MDQVLALTTLHPALFEHPFPFSRSSIEAAQALVDLCPALTRQTSPSVIDAYGMALLTALDNGANVSAYYTPPALRNAVYRLMLRARSPLLFEREGADQFIREMTQLIPAAQPRAWPRPGAPPGRTPGTSTPQL